MALLLSLASRRAPQRLVAASRSLHLMPRFLTTPVLGAHPPARLYTPAPTVTPRLIHASSSVSIPMRMPIGITRLLSTATPAPDISSGLSDASLADASVAAEESPSTSFQPSHAHVLELFLDAHVAPSPQPLRTAGDLWDVDVSGAGEPTMHWTQACGEGGFVRVPFRSPIPGRITRYAEVYFHERVMLLHQFDALAPGYRPSEHEGFALADGSWSHGKQDHEFYMKHEGAEQSGGVDNTPLHLKPLTVYGGLDIPAKWLLAMKKVRWPASWAVPSDVPVFRYEFFHHSPVLEQVKQRLIRIQEQPNPLGKHPLFPEATEATEEEAMRVGRTEQEVEEMNVASQLTDAELFTPLSDAETTEVLGRWAAPTNDPPPDEDFARLEARALAPPFAGDPVNALQQIQALESESQGDVEAVADKQVHPVIEEFLQEYPKAIDELIPSEEVLLRVHELLFPASEVGLTEEEVARTAAQAGDESDSDLEEEEMANAEAAFMKAMGGDEVDGDMEGLEEDEDEDGEEDDEEDDEEGDDGVGDLELEAEDEALESDDEDAEREHADPLWYLPKALRRHLRMRSNQHSYAMALRAKLRRVKAAREGGSRGGDVPADDADATELGWRSEYGLAKGGERWERLTRALRAAGWSGPELDELERQHEADQAPRMTEDGEFAVYRDSLLLGTDDAKKQQYAELKSAIEALTTEEKLRFFGNLLLTSPAYPVLLKQFGLHQPDSELVAKLERVMENARDELLGRPVAELAFDEEDEGGEVEAEEAEEDDEEELGGPSAAELGYYADPRGPLDPRPGSSDMVVEKRLGEMLDTSDVSDDEDVPEGAEDLLEDGDNEGGEEPSEDEASDSDDPFVSDMSDDEFGLSDDEGLHLDSSDPLMDPQDSQENLTFRDLAKAVAIYHELSVRRAVQLAQAQPLLLDPDMQTPVAALDPESQLDLEVRRFANELGMWGEEEERFRQVVGVGLEADEQYRRGDAEQAVRALGLHKDAQAPHTWRLKLDRLAEGEDEVTRQAMRFIVLLSRVLMDEADTLDVEGFLKKRDPPSQ